MEIKIFYLNVEQKEQYVVMENLLKEYISKNLIIDDCYFYRYGSLSDLSFKQYISLLNCSSIKYEDFNIIIKNQEPYRNLWTYYGSSRPYYDFAYSHMSIDSNMLKMLFPAVAMMDRMVILPKSIINTFDFDRNSFSWLPKPLEAGGAILVDFEDPDSMKESIFRLEKQLQYEISRLCIRQMAANNIPKPDFYVLSKLLKTSSDFIKEHSAEVYREINLKVEAVQESIPLNQESFVTLKLINKTEHPIGRIKVTIKAPSDTLDSQISEIIELDLVGKIEFYLSPKAKPYCPLEVSIEPYELGEESNPMQYPIILNVI